MSKAELAVMVAVLVTASLAEPKVAYSQCTRCCFPAANLTVTPATAQKGQPVVLTTGVLNCSPYQRVIIATVNLAPASSCTAYAEAFSIKVYVPPFQARTATYTFAAPKCSGTYKVIESVSNFPGSVTKTLTVN